MFSSKYLEWNCEDVKEWVSKIFPNDETIRAKFLTQEVDGITLMSDQILTDDSMALLGLCTLGRKAHFQAEIFKLKGM